MKCHNSIAMENHHKMSRPGIPFGLLFALCMLVLGSVPARAAGLSPEELSAAAGRIPADGQIYEIFVNEDDLLNPTVSDPVPVDASALEARFGHSFTALDPGSEVQADVVKNCRRAIINGLIARQEEVDVSAFRLSIEQVGEILDDIVDNEVRLFWWDHSMYSYGGMGNTCQYVANLQYLDQATTDALRENIALALTESITEDMTDLQKAISIYEWLCTNVDYDYTLKGHHTWHALIDRCCVCQGYAEAYSLLCRWVGVETGFASGGNHMWNSVKVNGTWYAVDCTWDADDGTIPGGVGHKYLLRSDAFMATHRHSYAGWDNECNDTSWDGDTNYWTDIQNKHSTSALFLFDGSGAYYLKWADENTCNVVFRSEATGEERIIKALTVASDDYEAVATGYLFYQGVSLTRVGDLLFFNDNTHVYCYQPSTDTLSTYFTYTDKATNLSAIYGVRNYKGSLLYRYGDLKDPQTGIRIMDETGDLDEASDYFYNFARNKGEGTLPYPDVIITWDDMDVDTGDGDVKRFVTRLYRIFLDRTPSQEEVAGWSSQLTAGTIDAGGAAAGFIFSPEFIGRNLCNDHFLEYLYRGLFDRPADETGFQGWLDLIDLGYSRERVVQGFLTSPEFFNLCESFDVVPGSGLANVPAFGTIQTAHCTITGCGNEAPVVTLVTSLYRTTLGRSPEAFEVEFWTGHLSAHDVTGRVLVNSFMNGEEYRNLGRSNEDYVTDLYAAIFNREPDEEGYRGWVDHLNRGELTREMVLNGFTGSQEFLNQCNHSGIEVGREI
ncbi:MAG: DUF4214 domain-containing protein [Lachnospiraceae bacterium]|nr:DUF4214 domain-containing protein [Lachnospiraceae bacterium]